MLYALVGSRGTARSDRAWRPPGPRLAVGTAAGRRLQQQALSVGLWPDDSGVGPGRPRQVLWRHARPRPLDSRAMCLAAGRIYYYSHGKWLGALEATSGQLLWRRCGSERTGGDRRTSLRPESHRRFFHLVLREGQRPRAVLCRPDPNRPGRRVGDGRAAVMAERQRRQQPVGLARRRAVCDEPRQLRQVRLSDRRRFWNRWGRGSTARGLRAARTASSSAAAATARCVTIWCTINSST